MYLTDYRELTLKEVITKQEPGLFKKVTGIDVSDFELLCDIGVFNSALMNDAVYNFKRYEDSSLSYTGINMHSGDTVVGGFDETITRKEFVDRPETNVSIVDTIPKLEEEAVKEETGESLDITKDTPVNHEKFGKGRVVTISGDKIWVSFKDGYKTFRFPEDIENGFLQI
jgi:hypothetical protein